MKKFLFLLTFLLSTAYMQAQFNQGEYVAGNGLTTYSEMDNNNNNTYTPDAQCGTVHRYTRFEQGQIISFPNNATCNWVLLDGNGSSNHFINKANWNSAIGNTYDIVGSNVKVTIKAINNTYIEILIEKLNESNCHTSVFGLNYTYSGFGTYLNTLQHTCSDCVDPNPDPDPNPNPNSCLIEGELTTCEKLNCIKLTKKDQDTSCTDCYCVKVNFTDGTVASFDASFSQGNSIMHCYDKPIKNYTLTAKPDSECNECVTQKDIIKPLKKQLNNEGLKLYPNPTNISFSLSGIMNDDITHVKIFDIQGKELKSYTRNDKYRVNDLKKGIYIVKVYNNEKELTNRKFIKE